MARLIEVEDVRACPPRLTVGVGDVLLFHATGVRVRSGSDAVEVLGPFVQAVVGTDGHVVAPMGSPNTVLLRARRHCAGAEVGLIVGDPFHRVEEVTLVITVEPAVGT
jgi:hypothetical protein